MMICLTGAGGKTALLYALAEKAATEGKNVIVSTCSRRITMPAVCRKSASCGEAAVMLSWESPAKKEN